MNLNFVLNVCQSISLIVLIFRIRRRLNNHLRQSPSSKHVDDGDDANDISEDSDEKNKHGSQTTPKYGKHQHDT